MKPSDLATPAFMMNAPFTLDNRDANNPLMKAAGSELYDYAKAFRQWRSLYEALSSGDSFVYVMPDYGADHLQDLTFVANIGAYLPHSGDIVLSDFKSKPRRGEEQVGKRFFSRLGYRVHQSPHYWEGEADLKWMRDNLYIGGHGIRADIAAYRWMEEELGAKIVPVRMTDEKVYHFDCAFFPLDADTALVNVAALARADIRKIEEHLEIVEVPREHIYDGWTNGVRLLDKLLVDIPITPEGEQKKESRRKLEKLISGLGLEPVFVDLGEFRKSGADLSCCVFHLNFNNRKMGENERAAA